jgi:two-component system, chemotaxis family, protein-glutamate methylesterase/glutaminase
VIPKTPIRVLLVDDSPTALAVLKKLLSASMDIDVVGTARNGEEALHLISTLNPAVVCTDLEMPVMDGLELTKTIMATCPRPILVVSSLLQNENSGNVFRVLEAGAIDVLPKPRGGIQGTGQMNGDELIKKIKVLSGVVAVRRRARQAEIGIPVMHRKPPRRSMRIVAVGASTGGPQALHEVLGRLPANFPVPILCVQHIGTGFLNGLIEWLGGSSLLKVRVAESGKMPEPGTIYFPHEGTHLKIDQNGRLWNSSEQPVGGHRPSITVTFKSVACYYGSTAVGALLTGMGEDGAEGLKAISDAGGLTIAQDEQTSVVFGMPRQAIELGAVHSVLPINRIADALLEHAGIQELVKDPIQER